jgi:hypothetical protein
VPTPSVTRFFYCNYGPFSRELNEELTVLTALGYVKQTFKQDGTWYPVAVCSLTDLGKTALSLMEVSEPELMQKYAFEYSKRSLRDILDEVHEKSNLGQVEIGVVILEPRGGRTTSFPSWLKEYRRERYI